MVTSLASSSRRDSSPQGPDRRRASPSNSSPLPPAVARKCPGVRLTVVRRAFSVKRPFGGHCCSWGPPPPPPAPHKPRAAWHTTRRTRRSSFRTEADVGFPAGGFRVVMPPGDHNQAACGRSPHLRDIPKNYMPRKADVLERGWEKGGDYCSRMLVGRETWFANNGTSAVNISELKTHCRWRGEAPPPLVQFCVLVLSFFFFCHC